MIVFEHSLEKGLLLSIEIEEGDDSKRLAMAQGLKLFNHLPQIVAVLLIIILWSLQVHPYLNPADDSGRYMVLGESLAKNGQFRLLNEPHLWRDTLYVPGFPAIIALWLRLTGKAPGDIVLQVKFTQLLFLLGSIPLFGLLLKKTGISQSLRNWFVLLFALCPTFVAYANEVMSEIPILFFFLLTLVLSENVWRHKASKSRPLPGEGTWEAEDLDLEKRGEPSIPQSATPFWHRALALASAGVSYSIRAAGVIMLLSCIVWFWNKFGWKWAAAAVIVTGLFVGSWQMRNSQILKQDPPDRPSDTYMKQFTLRNPEKEGAGRIKLDVIGLLGRARRGFPPYIGNISRSALLSMSPDKSLWRVYFYVVAVPFTLLVLLGYWEAIRRRLWLSVGFCSLFWLFVAMWPWINPRFLVPILPSILMFLALGVERFKETLDRSPKMNPNPVTSFYGPVVLEFHPSLSSGILVLGFLVLSGYFLRVHYVSILSERKPTLPGYSLGRTKDEAGFYAACEWLKTQDKTTVVMGRPPYLLHLYSEHPCVQIEPATNPNVQEKAYMTKNRVAYLLYDTWYWSKTGKYLDPYLKEYGDKWDLVWEDKLGSKTRVYRRR